ncbi:ricin-type beta-trefoil lectin domain protein [Actinomadura sp. KC06]|uniref:ricin-type beta-trefoil lectin domain protein n=1 Tax=Actinomadura sp. KC06 TaxID=2530369 RepID=UPI001405068F|nr:ricin-type beta-trefoil lectin domain protein [Actinomadura sp. KC06]
MSLRFRLRSRFAVAVTAAAVVGGLVTAPAGAVIGDPVTTGADTFTARIQIGAQRACSGALVAPNWVLTAKSCFAAEPGGRAAGPQKLPAARTTVTAGAGDLTQAPGFRAQVTDLVEHPARDLALVEFDGWAYNVQPIAIGAAPEPGEKLRVTGYGRTSDTWTPDTAHTTTVTVGESTGATFAVTGDGDNAPICKGDAGGPAFRERDGKPELVAVHHTTGLRGCLGAPEDATPGATETRVDDLASWITSSTDRRSLPASADRWIRPTGYMCASRYGTRLRWDGRYLSVVDWAQNRRGGVVTDNEGSEYLHFHADGNLVVWKGGVQQWTSRTAGHPNARLECGDDGGVSIIDVDGKVLWQSGTGPVLHARTEFDYGAKAQLAPVCASPDNQTRLMWNGSYLGVYDAAGRPRGRTMNYYYGGDNLHFHGDGNLVIWKDGKIAWSSATANHPNAQLICQNDGDVVLRDGGSLLWRAGTSPQVAAGAVARLGISINYLCVSPDRRTKLLWMFGELDSSDGWRSGGPINNEDLDLVFRPDGNLVLVNKAGAVRWATNTAGHPNAVLRCQDDGNVAIVDGTTKLWDTNSRPTGLIRANTNPKLCLMVVGSGDPVMTEDFLCDHSFWTVNPEGPIHTVFHRKCMDAKGKGTADRTPVIGYTCVPGATNQIWKPGPNGSLVNPTSGKCLDIPNGSTEPYAKLQLYTCNGSKAQRWTLPAPLPPGQLDPGIRKDLKGLLASRAAE